MTHGGLPVKKQIIHEGETFHVLLNKKTMKYEWQNIARVTADDKTLPLRTWQRSSKKSGVIQNFVVG